MNIPDHLQDVASDALRYEYTANQRRSLWAVVLGLTPILDGSQWCVLLGENLQDGVAGFGNSPSDAIYDFEKQFHRSVASEKPNQKALTDDVGKATGNLTDEHNETCDGLRGGRI